MNNDEKKEHELALWCYQVAADWVLNRLSENQVQQLDEMKFPMMHYCCVALQKGLFDIEDLEEKMMNYLE